MNLSLQTCRRLLLVIAGYCILVFGTGIRAEERAALPGKLKAPRLTPDYAGITLPPNIAPLNFKIEEPGRRYRVEVRSAKGESILISSRDPAIKIPLKQWRVLLQENAGQACYLEIALQSQQGEWIRFETITNQIASEPIDGHLVYRLLKPLYNTYANIGIYQRDLHSFEERPVIENSKVEGNCINCHTFLNHRSDTFALNFRTASKTNPMILVRSNAVSRVDKTLGYMSWHPGGGLLAFSRNKFSLFFHTQGETRDVFDATSDVGIYRVNSDSTFFPPALAQTNRNETWPAWSPDGHHLYYCSAPMLPVQKFRQVRYDLMRISYDPDGDHWGEPEVLVSAQDTGLSANQPKISPDGRFVLFCLSRYGNFPVYQQSSDLYVLDLSMRQCRRLAINSEQSDSWHCWSSNSRWIVFSSKRLDGLFARPFFSYVNERGEFHKPFVLPQADPAFYESYLKTYNVPELISRPVKVRASEIAERLLSP